MADPAHARRTAQRFVRVLAANGTTTALVFGSHFPERPGGAVRGGRGPRPADRQRPRRVRPQPAPGARGHARRRLPRRAARCSSAGTAAGGSATPSRRASPCPAPSRCSTPAARCSTRRRTPCSPATSTRTRARSPSWRAVPGREDYVGTYEDAGLLRDRSVLAHNVHVSDDELRRLAAAQTAIAHCPSSNAFLASRDLRHGPPRRARRALRARHGRRRRHGPEHAQGGPGRLPRADGARPGPPAPARPSALPGHRRRRPRARPGGRDRRPDARQDRRPRPAAAARRTARSETCWRTRPTWEAALGAIFTLAREESVLEVRVGRRRRVLPRGRSSPGGRPPRSPAAAPRARRRTSCP